MYTFLIFVHVLALVYWLGGDLGTYLSSRYALRDDLSVEARQTAFGILLACDMGPKLAMPVIVGAGMHLSTLLWTAQIPAWLPFVSWSVVGLWLALILAQHSSLNAKIPMLSSVDLVLRFCVVATLIGFTLWASSNDLPFWLLAKLTVFVVLVLCGIAVRFALKPFAQAWVKLVTEGASAEVNQALNTHMAVCRRYVWIIWFGLFLNTALGVRFIGI